MNVLKFASGLLLLSLLLIACGGGGTTSKTTAPTISEFTASSSTIDAGEETTLNWVIEGTTPISTSISSLGDVTGNSVTVSPTTTTTYTLSAENSVGKVTKDVTITVNSTAKLNIKIVDWVTTNYHPTFNEGTGQISFYVDFVEDIKADDLKSIQISTALNTEISWFYEGDEIKDKFYTLSDGTKGLAIENLTDPFIAKNRSVVSLGIYNFLITLKDGEEISFTHNVSAPGSKGTNGKNYAYTENYPNASNPLATYTPLLKRAQIKSATLDDSSSRLTVKFSVNKDNRVYNGNIWMYDEDGNYLGALQNPLRNFETGDISPYINSGTSFRTGGAVNTVAVEAPQIEFTENGKSVKDISFIVIGLYDGFQYRGTDSTIGYNSESISTIKLVDAGPNQ